jgi:predicted RNA binding protein YcfA (HicA-like mRNA interferase family)
MSKLPQISGRECITALEKAGFYVVRQKGSHVLMKRDDPLGRGSVPNHKVLKKGMLRGIIKDAGLTVDEFLALR